MIINRTTERSVKTMDDYKKLDRSQLIDLLQYKTKLLITASVLKVPDKVYLEELKKEVEELQKAIKADDTRLN